jgi:hypothetical protein
MKLIRFIMQKIIKIEKDMLGRWNTEICNKKIDKKIYLANIDNCGTCNNNKK